MKKFQKTLSLNEVATSLNLSESHVRRLVFSQELRPLSWTKKSAVFRYEDVARYAKRLKKKRLASLKLIARASEEIGLYDEQDAEAFQADCAGLAAEPIGLSQWRSAILSKETEKTNETDEQFSHRIRAEAREKILKSSKPLDLKAVLRSMEIEEPTHLSNLSKRPKSDE